MNKHSCLLAGRLKACPHSMPGACLFCSDQRVLRQLRRLCAGGQEIQPPGNWPHSGGLLPRDGRRLAVACCKRRGILRNGRRPHDRTVRRANVDGAAGSMARWQQCRSFLSRRRCKGRCLLAVPVLGGQRLDACVQVSERLRQAALQSKRSQKSPRAKCNCGTAGAPRPEP